MAREVLSITGNFGVLETGINGFNFEEGRYYDLSLRYRAIVDDNPKDVDEHFGPLDHEGIKKLVKYRFNGTTFREAKLIVQKH